LPYLFDFFLALSTMVGADTLSTEDPDSMDPDKDDTPIFEKHNDLLHGETTGRTRSTR